MASITRRSPTRWSARSARLCPDFFTPARNCKPCSRMFMKPFEERFTAWVDGQLSGDELAEFEKELAQHPDAASERAAAQKLTKLLREHSTAPALTNAEFFNLQIQQHIT